MGSDKGATDNMIDRGGLGEVGVCEIALFGNVGTVDRFRQPWQKNAK